MEFNMLDVGLWGFATRLVYFLTLIVVAWYVLRGLDLATGVTFKEVHRVIRSDPRAAADYHGKRLLALAISLHAVF